MVSSVEKNKAEKKTPPHLVILNEEVRVEFTEKANFVQRPKGRVGDMKISGEEQ